MAGTFETCPVNKTTLYLQPGSPGVLGVPSDRNLRIVSSDCSTNRLDPSTSFQQRRRQLIGNLSQCGSLPRPQFLQLLGREAGQGHFWAPYLPLYLLCTEGREPKLCVPGSLPLLRKVGFFDSISLLGPLLLMCFTCLAWPVEWMMAVVSTCTGGSAECWTRPGSQERHHTKQSQQADLGTSPSS